MAELNPPDKNDERRQRSDHFEEDIDDLMSKISVDFLLDLTHAFFTNRDTLAFGQAETIDPFLQKYEKIKQMIVNSRPKPDDFQILKTIGSGGHFSEVKLVRRKHTKKVYAMKILPKTKMLKNTSQACFWEERAIGVSAKSEWIVKTNYAFQDIKNLYLVMDFMPGGDLVTLIDKNGTFSEKCTKFYTAEVILALDALHSMGFLHRDIKPDNMLLDHQGHIKLTDFGVSARMDDQGLVHEEAVVGTEGYISPEVLNAKETKKGYGREVDFWSLGVTVHLMLIGKWPKTETVQKPSRKKIKLNKKSDLKKSGFSFPKNCTISNEARHLIRSLLAGRDERLGRNGIDEFKEHPFFANEKWSFENIRQCTAPNPPELSGVDDTSNFDNVTERKSSSSKGGSSLPVPETTFEGNHLSFVGFTYSGDYQLQWGTALSATAAAGQSEPENSSGLPGKTNGGSVSNPPKQNSAQTDDVVRIEKSQIVGEQEKMTYEELECKYHLALRQIKKQGNEIGALSKKKLELEKKLAEPNDSFGKAPVPNQAPVRWQLQPLTHRQA